MKKLSIIIPVYNVEKFLDKCLQSVINQTLRDIEIILVDDQSPDNCPQMCDEYARRDSRIKVVHRKNSGAGISRNCGLEIASGEYVTFLDSDDFVDLHTYEHLYNIAKKGSIDVVYYDFDRFTNEEQVTPNKPNDNITLFEDGEIKELMLDIIASEPSAKADHKIQCSVCTAMYRTSIIKDNNVRFPIEKDFMGEDMVFNLDYLKFAQKAAYNKAVYYHYRMNPNSRTGTFRTDRVELQIGLYRYIINNINFWGLDKDKCIERAKRLFIGCSRSFMCKILSSNIASKDKRDLFKKVMSYDIWKEIPGSYPVKKLPLYPRLFFFGCITNNYYFVSLLYSIKKALQ